MTRARAEAIWVWVERASWVVILLGIPSFFLEQYFRSNIERASNTLEFVKKYQEPNMVAQRFALLRPWLQYNVQQLEAQGISTRAINDTVFNLIKSSEGTDSDMRVAIFDIVDFFETLLVCIEIDRCNKKIATSYFKEYANQFYCLYEPYITQLRRQQQMPKNYACSVSRFAGTCDTRVQNLIPTDNASLSSSTRGETSAVVKSSPVPCEQ